MTMSFSGKKFRRTGYENVGKIAQCSDPFIQTMKKYPPVFCFTRINENTFNYWLQTRDQHLTFNFRLGQEHHMEKRDGSKISMTFTLENDNVLRQMIKQPAGKICCFRREFGTNDAKMTITVEGSTEMATIFYGVVQ